MLMFVVVVCCRQGVVNSLTVKNSELASQVTQLQSDLSDYERSLHSTPDTVRSEQLAEQLQQLEEEREQLISQLRDEQHERLSMETMMSNSQRDLAMQGGHEPSPPPPHPTPFLKILLHLNCATCSSLYAIVVHTRQYCIQSDDPFVMFTIYSQRTRLLP